jgi:hypothetical protein
MYASNFKQLACDISWDEITLMNQFQYGLWSDVKDLLFTMSNSSTLSQAIVQVVRCNNRLFERRQEKHWESQIVPKKIAPTMSFPSTSTSKDVPMQINWTQFKPLMEQEKQWQCVNKLCMYCEELGHIIANYPKKQLLHTTQATSIHTPLENLGNKDV